jgi:MATE family multidrug resistance protein
MSRTIGESRSELRATIALAVPVVLVQVGFTSMGLVDTIMVGRVSAAVLAAVALGNLYFINVAIFGMGTLLALDPLVAQAAGAGDSAAVSQAMQRGVVIALGLAALTCVLLAPAGIVLRAFGQPPSIVPDAASYVHISIAGALPFFLFIVLRQSLQALHRVAPIVWTMVAANLTNAGFNWVFVYGHLGSPALGAAGSAVATAISRWIGMLMLMVVAWPELRSHLLPVQRDVLNRRALGHMLRLGMPIGAQQALEMGAFGAIGLLMGVLGTVEMAAHQIAITLASLTFMVPVGVATAAAIRVGRAIGARNEAGARAAIRAAYICGLGFMTLTGIVFVTLPHLLARAFTTDLRVAALAAALIPIAGLFQIFDGAQAVGAGVLRGAGDTAAPMVGMLGAYWILGVPVGAYLGFHTALGAPGLWWGFVVSLAAVAVFLLVRIRIVLRRGLARIHH